MSPSSRPGSDRRLVEDLEDELELACDLDELEISRLSRALRCELERGLRDCPPPRLPPMREETRVELLVLLSVLRVFEPTKSPSAPEPPKPSKIDELTEDMCDPEFGLRPARMIITQAAEKILRGDEALRLPRSTRQRRSTEQRSGDRLDED